MPQLKSATLTNVRNNAVYATAEAKECGGFPWWVELTCGSETRTVVIIASANEDSQDDDDFESLAAEEISAQAMAWGWNVKDIYLYFMGDRGECENCEVHEYWAASRLSK